jgi:hypothetical protein
VALAWGVGLGNVADGLRASAPLWPRPVGHVPYQGAWRDMASDPRPGAVLDLPVETTQYARGGYLLEALYHGRATTALPRAEGADFDSGVCRTRDLVRTAMDRGDGGDEATARAVVAARGFRYLVFHPEVPNQGGIRAEALVRAFGEPRVYSSLLVWTLDPGEVTGSDASASDRPPLDP